MTPKDKYIMGIDPYEFPVQVRDDLPNSVFYMQQPNGLVEQVCFEWSDKEKKNVIVTKVNNESNKI